MHNNIKEAILKYIILVKGVREQVILYYQHIQELNLISSSIKGCYYGFQKLAMIVDYMGVEKTTALSIINLVK